MAGEIKQPKRPSLRFNESEIKLALTIMDKMQQPIELMYYLLEREKENPFVILFISAQDINLKEILNHQKRDTDILFTINKENNLYSIICQETKVDGAYRFAQRLLQSVIDKKGHSIYCTEMEVRSSKYSIKEILFKAIEMYMNAVKEKKEKEIIFRSLY